MANYYFLDKKLSDISFQISSFSQNSNGYTFLSGSKRGGGEDYGDSKIYAYLNGSLAWEYGYESADNNSDGVLSSSADAAGNLFISGHGSYFDGVQLKSSTSAEDGFISKINYSDGTVLWTEKVDISKSADYVTSVSSNKDGGAYFLASGGGWYGASKFESYNSVIFKSDASGNTLWQKTVNSSNNIAVTFGVVEAQTNGDVITTGLLNEVSGSGYCKKYFFIKTFNSAGDLKFSYTSPDLIGRQSADTGTQIAQKSDGEGNTYISWVTYDQINSQEAVIHLQKYNASGLIWSKDTTYEFDDTNVNNTPVTIRSLGILKDGNIALLGELNRNTASGASGFGGSGFVLFKANSNNGEILDKIIVGDKSNNSSAFGSVDQNGDVFFAGTTSYGLKISGSDVFNQILFSDSRLEGDGYGLVLSGTDNKDVMSGSTFDDDLYGKYGDDVMKGFAGADELFGDYGADNLNGGYGDDYLYGGYGKDKLYGELGDDLIYGEQGEDSLYGGDGNDVIDGGIGADYMSGGKGSDIYYVDNAKDMIIDNGATLDFDTVIVIGTVQLILPDNIEDAEVDPTAGKAGLIGNSLDNDLTGNDQANNLKGGDGEDVLNGGGGSDSLSGGAGNDIVDAGAGSDVITGDLGNDEIDGGVGIDIISYTSIAAAITIDLTSGEATSSAGNDVAKIGVDSLFDIENVIAGKYDDVVKGNMVANVLTGGLGSDSLYGGSDKVKDVFDFNAIAESKTGTTRDKVYDFITKIDNIDLSGIDANTAKAKAGDQAFLFNTNTAKANSIWYKAVDVDGDKKANDLIIYGDVDGNTTADFEIGLVGVTAIAASDFVL